MVRILFGAVAVLVLAPGCALTAGQKAAVQRFSAATTTFAETASQEFARSRADVIEMNRLRREITSAAGRTVPPLADDQTCATASGTFEEGEEPICLDYPLLYQDVKDRLDALEALARYGLMLEAFATSSDAADLQALAQSFVTALRKVESLAIDDAAADALTAIVSGVGNMLIEARRRQAVIDVVEFSHPIVLKLTRLVESSYDPSGEGWSLGYDGAVEDLDFAALALRQKVAARTGAGDDDGDEGDGNQPDSSAAVLSALAQRGRDLAADNQQRFAAISQKIRTTCETLRAAQENLRAALRDPAATLDSLSMLIDEVHELVLAVRTLRPAA